jgi:hypothetical protein
MALKASTGLRNYLANVGSLKAALNDGIINIYSGSAPASADDPPTGVLLLKLTKDGAAVTGGTKSTKQKDTVTVTAGSQGDTFTITVNTVGYTYTQGNGDTATVIASALADLLDDCRAIRAISSVGVVILESRFAGESYTLDVSKTGGGTINKASIATITRINSIHLGSPTNGVIAKAGGETVSGTGVADGAASYFRYVTSEDTGADSSTERRLQGSCGTAGADLEMTSIQIYTGQPNTQDGLQLTVPEIIST